MIGKKVLFSSSKLEKDLIVTKSIWSAWEKRQQSLLHFLFLNSRVTSPGTNSMPHTSKPRPKSLPSQTSVAFFVHLKRKKNRRTKSRVTNLQKSFSKILIILSFIKIFATLFPSGCFSFFLVSSPQLDPKFSQPMFKQSRRNAWWWKNVTWRLIKKIRDFDFFFEFSGQRALLLL